MESVSVTPPYSSWPGSPPCVSHSSTSIESTPSEKLSTKSWAYFGQILVHLMTSVSLHNVRGRIGLEQEKKGYIFGYNKSYLINATGVAFLTVTQSWGWSLPIGSPAKINEICYCHVQLHRSCMSLSIPVSLFCLFLIHCILDMTLPNLFFFFLIFINFSECVDNILQSLLGFCAGKSPLNFCMHIIYLPFLFGAMSPFKVSFHNFFFFRLI